MSATELPNPANFCKLTQALAMLDAILSPDWEQRYYSFNSNWANGEKMASMRDGSLDRWFALISAAGVALQGLASDLPLTPGLFDDLPPEFRSNFLEEPAFLTEESNFCWWRTKSDTAWQRRPAQVPESLGILRGEPEDYRLFAAEYYERTIALADVAAIYRHDPLTEALLTRLNPEMELASLAEDITEIGYPALLT
jgi:hypothetical protein